MALKSQDTPRPLAVPRFEGAPRFPDRPRFGGHYHVWYGDLVDPVVRVCLMKTFVIERCACSLSVHKLGDPFWILLALMTRLRGFCFCTSGSTAPPAGTIYHFEVLTVHLMPVPVFLSSW